MRIYSQDIGMELGIQKIYHANNEKRKTTMKEGIEETIKTLEEKETYKYLGILKSVTIKQAVIKEKKRKKGLSQENKKTTLNKIT